LPGFDALQSYDWTFVTSAAGITGFSPDQFVIDADDFADPYPGVFAVAQQGDSLAITYNPVPELSALTLVAVAAAGVRKFPDPPRVLPADPGARIVPVMSHCTEAGNFFRAKGFAHRMGWGKYPAVLVVDLACVWTDPASPLGADFSREIGETRRILDAARQAGVPVFFSTICYDEEEARDAGLWTAKIPHLASLRSGTPAVAIDPRLGRREDEPVIAKKFASVFFGTSLAERLRAQGIDTLILTGCTTSGCVRATAVDAISHGLRPIIAREAVGDRWPAAHEQSLIDLEAKYADVEPVGDVVAKIRTSGKGAGK
jgi:maleamate amidohydrolase